MKDVIEKILTEYWSQTLLILLGISYLISKLVCLFRIVLSISTLVRGELTRLMSGARGHCAIVRNKK